MSNTIWAKKGKFDLFFSQDYINVVILMGYYHGFKKVNDVLFVSRILGNLRIFEVGSLVTMNFILRCDPLVNIIFDPDDNVPTLIKGKVVEVIRVAI